MKGLARLLITAAGAIVVALIICTYANPYSLHVLTRASYTEFDNSPTSSGGVLVNRRTLDFRLPKLTLSDASVAVVRDECGADAGCTTAEIVSSAVQVVRERLNESDDELPSGYGVSADKLLQFGDKRYCLCSEHAVLLNEILQACGMQSRIIWLAGHVVNEYYDHRRNNWVFVDSHQNVSANDENGDRLSVSQLIWRVERNIEAALVPAVAGTTTEPQDYDPKDEAKRLHYRNVLLNGECYCETGETISGRGRWSQLFWFQSRPHIMYLSGRYDPSFGQFVEPLRGRKVGVCAAMLFVVMLFVSRRHDREV